MTTPIMHQLNEEQWKILKHIIQSRCRLLWVISGGHLDVVSPEQADIAGFLRTIRSEEQLQLMTLDVQKSTERRLLMPFHLVSNSSMRPQRRKMIMTLQISSMLSVTASFTNVDWFQTKSPARCLEIKAKPRRSICITEERLSGYSVSDWAISTLFTLSRRRRIPHPWRMVSLRLRFIQQA